jgi:hypothetical protein
LGRFPTDFSNMTGDYVGARKLLFPSAASGAAWLVASLPRADLLGSSNNRAAVPSSIWLNRKSVASRRPLFMGFR